MPRLVLALSLFLATAVAAASANDTTFWTFFGASQLSPTSAYSRSSPSSWTHSADSSGVTAVGDATGKTEVLLLSSTPRLSHGPRRRRRRRRRSNPALAHHIKGLLDVPLYCWKVLIDCRRFTRHVCCPVMPAFLQAKDHVRRGRRDSNAYIDPLFGIRVVAPQEQRRQNEVPAADNKTDPDATLTTFKDRQDYQQKVQEMLYRHHQLTLQRWRQQQQHHGRREQGVQQVDRLFTIGPYVQTSIFENWMSALFQLFGNEPLYYLVAKKLLALTIFGACLVLWGWLGQTLGFVRLPSLKALFRSDAQRDHVVDLTSRVMLSLEDDNWMQTLIGRNKESLKDVNRFLCCFVSDEQKVKTARAKGFVQCFPSNKRKGQKYKTPIECVSDLMYDITFNQQKGEPNGL